MAKTREEIARLVLLEVGELATGQTPSDADMAICRDAYDQVYAELQAPELLAPWGDGEEVPDNSVRPIVSLVAWEVRTAFSIDAETETKIARNVFESLPRLRQNTHANYVPDTTEVEYF